MYRNLLLSLGFAGNVLFYGGISFAEFKGAEYLITSRQQTKEIVYVSAKAATIGLLLAGATALQLREHDSLEKKIR